MRFPGWMKAKQAEKVECPRCHQMVKPDAIDVQTAERERAGRIVFDSGFITKGFGLYLGGGTKCGVCDSILERD